MSDTMQAAGPALTKPVQTPRDHYLFSNRDLLLLFVPIVAELFLEYLVGLADTIMVSHVGEAAVSGVSLVNFIMQLIISVFAAVCTGGAVIAGQYLGKKDAANSQEAATQLVRFTSGLGIGIMLLTLVCKDSILQLLFGQVSGDVRANAGLYYDIVIPSIPFLALINAGAAVFRTSGNSKLPMKIMLAVNLMNVLGNALLIYGFRLGTIGIAIPTLVSRVTGAVILIVLVSSPRYPLHISRSLAHRFDWGMVRRILQVGIPFGLENSLFYLGRLLILSLISTLGTPSIAANSIALALAFFSVLPGLAVNVGMTTVISQCVGAGDYEQVRFYHRRIMFMNYAALLLVNVVIISGLPAILGIYHLSGTTYRLTYQMVSWHAIAAVIIWPLAYSFPVTFRSAGDARFPMVTAIISMFLCRVVMSYVFIDHLGLGVFWTYIAMFLDWVVKAVIFSVHYRRRAWMRFQLT